MMCPKCGHGVSFIKETRHVGAREAPHALRRRRECAACHEMFTTYEIDGGIWRAVTPTVRIHAAAMIKVTARHWRDQEIVRRVRNGEKRYLLAEEFGVAPNTISHITAKAGVPRYSRAKAVA